MSTPKTRNLKAWIDLMPGSPPGLHVTGEVETGGSIQVPKLTEATPQGINPRILILDLKIVTEGEVGTPSNTFHPTRFDMPAKRGQYTQVAINFEGKSVAQIDVKETQ